MTYESHEAMRKRLIEENKDAPVDRVIRKLFELGAVNMVDTEEGLKLGTAEEALDLWYNLDSLEIRFELNGRRGWMSFIHQDKMSRPHLEDISDYHCWLEDEVEELKPLLVGEEGVYRTIFTD